MAILLLLARFANTSAASTHSSHQGLRLAAILLTALLDLWGIVAVTEVCMI